VWAEAGREWDGGAKFGRICQAGPNSIFRGGTHP